MLKAIFWKELRELMPAIVAAPALQFLIVISVTRPGQTRPLDASDLRLAAILMAQSCFLFVVVVGVWQNKTEKNQGTFLFLLQPPMRREVIVGAKLFAGICICTLVAIVPLAAFAGLATTIKHVSQYREPIFDFVWPYCTSVLLVYLGAFMSSLRDDAWFKTQFLPLFAAIAVFVLFLELVQSSTPTMLTMLTGIGSLYVIFVLAILHQAVTRDY